MTSNLPSPRTKGAGGGGGGGAACRRACSCSQEEMTVPRSSDCRLGDMRDGVVSRD